MVSCMYVTDIGQETQQCHAADAGEDVSWFVIPLTSLLPEEEAQGCALSEAP